MQEPLQFDDLIEEQGEVVPFDDLVAPVDTPTDDRTLLPQKRVDPGEVARKDAVQTGVRKGGSPLNRAAARPIRWIGSVARTGWEGLRGMRPIGIRGLSRQKGGLTGAAAQVLGEQESLVNIKSTDGRKLTYAEGTPEAELQRRMQEAQGRGEDIYAFMESDEMKRYLSRHKLKPLRFGVDIGAVSLFPGLADSFGSFGESAGWVINKLFGTQMFGNAENARQMWGQIADTWQIHTPEGREAFLKALDEDPGQVLADGGMMMMLGGKASGGLGRANVAIGRKAGMQANVRRNMMMTGVQLQRLSRVLNEGFVIPGISPRPMLAGTRGFFTEYDALGRRRSRFGLSEIIDPEEIGARVGMEGPQLALSGALSPFASEFEPSYRDRLRAMGIDPMHTIASIQSRSQLVATKEAKREQDDHAATIAGIETAVLGIETRIEEILAEHHASGDISQAGKAIGQALEAFENRIRAEAQKGYDRETPERRDFIMSLRNTYQVLYGEGGIIEESKQLEESVGYSDFSENRILKGFDETMERIAQTGESGLDPEFVAGQQTERETPLQGGERKQSAVDLGDVQSANRQGTARRLAISPTQQLSGVEYDVAPLEFMIASHTLDGQVNPVFEALAQELGGGTLQTREYNDRKVRNIASNIRPEGLLLDLMSTDRGAPIAVPVEVTSEMAQRHEVLAEFEGETLNLVLAGNNRVEALEMAQAEYPADYALYQSELPNVLPDYGFEMDAAQDLQSPVLYRKLLDADNVNLQQFADDSNADVARRHTTGEQAVKDSLKLTDDILGRLNLNLQGNLGDVLQDESNLSEQGGTRLWLQALEAEAGDMYVETTDPATGDTRTELTQAGVERLENALFRRVFSSPQGLKMLELFETVQNSGIRNIQKGVQDSLLAVARVEVGARQGNISEQYRIADAIAEAVVGAWQMAQTGSTQGKSIAESIRHFGANQAEFPGVTALVSGVARDLLDVLEAGVSEPGIVSRFLTDYGDTAAAQAPETDMMAQMGMELPSQESLIYRLKDRHLGDGELDAMSEDMMRVGMEHMTTDEQTYQQILKDRQLRASPDEIWYGGSHVFFSLGPYYREWGHGVENFGFIFSTNDLEKLGITPVLDDLIGDSTISQALKIFYPHLKADIERAAVDHDLTTAVRAALQELLDKQQFPLEKLSEFSNEFKLGSPLRFADAAPVAVIENRQIKVITEASRGEDPSQWQFREPTEAELTDIKGLKQPGFLSTDAPGGLGRAGWAIKDVKGEIARRRTIAQKARDTEALEEAQQWTDTDREQFIRELVDSQYYKGDWMNRMREQFEKNPELAKAQFGADDPDAAVKKWFDFVDKEFIDVWDAEQKADLVRVQLSERSKSFDVKGREVSGHREIAVISQALRDPGREHMTVFYVDEGVDGSYTIRGHETTTLNAPGQVSAEAIRDINTRRAGYSANTKVVFLHNHPSAAAAFSDGDISSDNRYRSYFSGNYLGYLVIDSGEYAQSWRRPNGVFERETHIPLEAGELGWDPQWNDPEGSEFVQPQIRQNDPLYLGAEDTPEMWHWRTSVRGTGVYSNERALQNNVIRFGKSMQIDHNWTVFAMQGSWGRLNALVQVKDFHKIPKAHQAQFLRNLSLDYGGSRVYVYVGKGDWYNRMSDAVKVFTDINDSEHGGGIMSVMVDGFTRGWTNAETGFQERMWKPQRSVDRSGRSLDTHRQWIQGLDRAVQQARREYGDQPGNNIFFRLEGTGRDTAESTSALMTLFGEEAGMSTQEIWEYMLDDWNSTTQYKPGYRHFGSVDEFKAWVDAHPGIVFKEQGHNGAGLYYTGAMGVSSLTELRKYFSLHGEDDFNTYRDLVVFEGESLGRSVDDDAEIVKSSRTLKRYDMQSNAFRRSARRSAFRPQSGDTGPGERQQARRSNIDLTAQRTPYTYGKAEAFSTHLRRKIEQLERSETHNPQELRWYKKLRNALEADMDESLRAHKPELADKIDAVDLAYAVGMTKANSSFARHIVKNLGSDLVEGTDNYRRMVMGLFSPQMDVASVGLVYELLGGFDSDASQRMRRVFLDEIFSSALTPRARMERGKRKAGKTGVLRSWQRISPSGLSSSLGKWQKNTGQYPAELLEAILGKQTVDALYELDSVSQQFERIVQKLGGSQTAPWMKEFLRSDYRAEKLYSVLLTLSGALGIGGASLGADTGLSIGISAVSFITAWLGNKATSLFLEHLKDKPVGKRYLLEGTVVSMGHVLTGDPIFTDPDTAAKSREKARQGRGVARPSTLRAIRRIGRPRKRDEEEKE